MQASHTVPLSPHVNGDMSPFTMLQATLQNYWYKGDARSWRPYRVANDTNTGSMKCEPNAATVATDGVGGSLLYAEEKMYVGSCFSGVFGQALGFPWRFALPPTLLTVRPESSPGSVGRLDGDSLAGTTLESPSGTLDQCLGSQ